MLTAILATLAAAPGALAATPKEADERLDRGLRELTLLPGGPPGAISIVQRGEDRTIHRAGVANVEFGAPIKLRDTLRLASTSKAFSGAVALRLVERDELELDRGIREVLPWLPPGWEAVTLRTALQHTSGLPDYTSDPGFGAAFGADPRRFFTPEQLVAYVTDDPLLFAPGSSYEYSNTDNIVVALIAEAVTGRSYESLLRRFVLRPLDLRRTLMPPGFTLPQPYAHGYSYEGPGKPLDDVSEALNPSGAWASGGLVSTPADLSTFFRAYAGRDLLGKKVRREQRRFFDGGTSEPPGPGHNSAGLALFRYETRCGRVYGHTGSFPGYTQFAAATPNGARSATVSINLQPSETQPPGVLAALRDTFELAVCAARPGKDRS